jgi:tRNA modification GTPase
MSSFAAMMTAPSAGAIATIQLTGDSARGILTRVFKPTGSGPAEFTMGRVLLGHIVDGIEPVDQVTIGCEAPGSFAIHCHGNPLIVEAIMKLLERHGVGLLSSEQLLARTLAASHPQDTIAAEAKLALTTVKTLEGAELIAGQVETGLLQKATQWRRQLESTPHDDLASDVRQVLQDSDVGRLIIEGCTVALIGPAGAGKSTLLNTLAGRGKAIVTGIKGTTRDWISAEIHIPPLAATIIDTAGLAHAEGDVDRAAQVRSMEILQVADLVLLVLDISEQTEQMDEELLARLSEKRVVTVLNKVDLPARLDVAVLPACYHDPVRISAKTGAGINELIAAIHRTSDVAEFDLKVPIAFTARQRRLLECLHLAQSRAEAGSIISELLEGPVSV